MKAPDTIYVAVYQDDDGINTHLGDWYSEPEYRAQDNIEYVRKDALMEWTKGRREAVAKEVVIQEGVRLGADAAFEELIDKLNEM